MSNKKEGLLAAYRPALISAVNRPLSPKAYGNLEK